MQTSTERVRIWREKNKKRTQELAVKNHRNWRKKYAEEDRIKISIHNQLKAAILKLQKNPLKLSPSQIKLLNHFEKLFTGTMNFSNYCSLWHIDHVIPVSFLARQYNYASYEHKKAVCNAFGNLQPMLIKDNASKGRTVPKNHKRLLTKIFLDSFQK